MGNLSPARFYLIPPPSLSSFLIEKSPAIDDKWWIREKERGGEGFGIKFLSWRSHARDSSWRIESEGKTYFSWAAGSSRPKSQISFD